MLLNAGYSLNSKVSLENARKMPRQLAFGRVSTLRLRTLAALLCLWLSLWTVSMWFSSVRADAPSNDAGLQQAPAVNEQRAEPETQPAPSRVPVGGSAYFFGHIFVKPDPQDIGEALSGVWTVDIGVLSRQSGRKLPPSRRWPARRARLSVREVASYKPPPPRGALEKWLIPDGIESGSMEFKDERGKRVPSAPFRLIRLETDAPWRGRFTFYDLKDTDEADGGAMPTRESDFVEWFRFDLERLPQSGIWGPKYASVGNETLSRSAETAQDTRGSQPASSGLIYILDRNHFLLIYTDELHDELVYLSGLRGDTILPNSRMSKLGPALLIGLISIGAHLAFHYLNRYAPHRRLATHAAIARAVHARDRDRMWRQQYEYARLDTPRGRAQTEEDKRD